MFLTQQLFFLILIQSVPIDDVSPFLNYGIAGGLLFLIIVIFKYFRDTMTKDNTSRDDKYSQVVKDLKDVIEKVDRNYGDAINKFVLSNRDSIEKFIQVVNKQMDKSDYQTQIFTELRAKMEEHMRLERSDLLDLKKELLDALSKLTLNYEITPKQRN